MCVLGGGGFLEHCFGGLYSTLCSLLGGGFGSGKRVFWS